MVTQPTVNIMNNQPAVVKYHELFQQFDVAPLFLFFLDVVKRRSDANISATLSAGKMPVFESSNTGKFHFV